MLRLLLEAGADPEERRTVEVTMVDSEHKDSRDERPLYVAAKHGHEACVRVLLDHGKDVSCPTKVLTAKTRF